MNRRSFLKRLLCTTALAAVSMPVAIARTMPYVVFADLPLEAFGNRLPIYNIGSGIGQWLGSQIFPETSLDENQKGPRLKRNEDGTLWVREDWRPEEGLHP